MWADGLRQELDRYRWVLAALPLAGACVSAAALVACKTAADALLHLPDMDEDPVTEHAGEALPNYRRPERRTG